VRPYLRADRYRYSDGVRAVRVRFGALRLTGQFSLWWTWR